MTVRRYLESLAAGYGSTSAPNVLDAASSVSIILLDEVLGIQLPTLDSGDPEDPYTHFEYNIRWRWKTDVLAYDPELIQVYNSDKGKKKFGSGLVYVGERVISEFNISYESQTSEWSYLGKFMRRLDDYDTQYDYCDEPPGDIPIDSTIYNAVWQGLGHYSYSFGGRFDPTPHPLIPGDRVRIFPELGVSYLQLSIGYEFGCSPLTTTDIVGLGLPVAIIV